MAEEEPEEQQEGLSGPQPSLLRYLPVVLLVLMIQAGGAYFLIHYWLYRSDEGVATVADEEGRARVEVPEGVEPEGGLELKDVTVNPRDTKSRFLVTADVTLAVWPKAAKGEMEDDRNIDRVRDAVIAGLSNATPDMLRTQEGREKVKKDIRERINLFLYRGQVIDVYFGRFVQQAMAGYQRE